jgi:5'-nucleotidase
MKRTIRTRALGALGFVLLLFAAAWTADAASGVVTLLSINDMHSHVFPYRISVEGTEGRKDVEVGGLARAATLIRQEKAKDPGNVLALSIGDVDEGPLFYFYHGEVELRGLSLAGFDAGTLGNHEFDLGENVLRDALAWARFPIVVSNLQPRASDTRVPWKTYAIFTMQNGLKVGLFGLVPPELAMVTSGSDAFRAEQDLAAVANRMAPFLRDKGCDIVVAMSHAGLYADRALAASTSGIHAIVGGHSHDLLTKPEIVEGPGGWKTIIGQAGSMCRYLGVMTLGVKDGALDSGVSRWTVRELAADVPQDFKVSLILDPYQAELEKKLGVPIGPMDQADVRKIVVRATESAVGDFIADAFRWRGNTQIGIQNGGSIRGDRVIPAGNASYRTMVELMPYGNSLVRMTLTGRDIREAMEASASALIGAGDQYDGKLRTPTGGFQQVSGLRVTIDLRLPPALIDNDGVTRQAGRRVTSILVEEKPGAWSPLDDAKTYTVTTSTWVAGGGDKMTVLRKNARDLTDLHILDAEAVAEYVRLKGGMKPALEGRITLKR